jgi:hypothetical protein
MRMATVAGRVRVREVPGPDGWFVVRVHPSGVDSIPGTSRHLWQSLKRFARRDRAWEVSVRRRTEDPFGPTVWTAGVRTKADIHDALDRVEQAVRSGVLSTEPSNTGKVRAALADRTHRYRGAPPSFLFAALTSHRSTWLRLQPGEVEPNVLTAVADEHVVWSSLWPIAPNDTIEFDLAPWDGDGGSIRFRWFSNSPPDARGIGITRQRLNQKFADQLRGAVAEYVRGRRT